MWIIKKYDEKRVRKSLAQTRLRGWWGGGGAIRESGDKKIQVQLLGHTKDKFIHDA